MADGIHVADEVSGVRRTTIEAGELGGDGEGRFDCGVHRDVDGAGDAAGEEVEV